MSRLPLVLFSCLLPCAAFAAADAPDPVHGLDTMAHVDVPPILKVIARDPAFQLTLGTPSVVISGDGRQPYLFASRDGTLFCQAQLNLAPFHTKKNREVYHARIGTAISRDGGATWTPWTHAARHDDVFTEGGTVQCADGTILLLDTYIMPRGQPGHGAGEIWKSHDDLRTIEGPFEADFYLPGVEWGGSTGDTGIPHTSARLHRSVLALPNGDLLTLGYSRFKGDTAPAAYIASMLKTRVFVIRSRDQGATWSYLATVGVDSGVGTEGFGEPVFARVSSGAHAGRLVCLMRTGRELYGSHSDDAGLTWTRPLPEKIPGLDIYATEKWESLFVNKQAPGYFATDEMIATLVDPDLIEMRDGTLVCAVGMRAPARKYRDNWRAPENGDYLLFSRDGGDTWSHVVQFRSGAPTTHYIGVRELKPGVLYVVFDDNTWNMAGNTIGFQIQVKRAHP